MSFLTHLNFILAFGVAVGLWVNSAWLGGDPVAGWAALGAGNFIAAVYRGLNELS